MTSSSPGLVYGFVIVITAASIVSLSNNFSIGFGSFVEKRVSPFLSLNPAVQEDPCMNDNRFDCEPTYTYRHVISLTNDSNRFNVSTLRGHVAH